MNVVINYILWNKSNSIEIYNIFIQKTFYCSKNRKTLMIVVKDLKKLLLYFSLYLNFNYY